MATHWVLVARYFNTGKFFGPGIISFIELPLRRTLVLLYLY